MNKGEGSVLFAGDSHTRFVSSYRVAHTFSNDILHTDIPDAAAPQQH